MADIEYVLPDVTRIIVVDDHGTHGFNAEKGSVWYDLQDDGRTLRVFLSDQKPVELHNVQNAADPQDPNSL